MKALATILGIFILLTAPLAAGNFSPKENSPIAKGEHPRLFVTQDGVVAMRERITKYYKSDFQAFVSHMDAYYGNGPGSGIFDEWNDIFCGAQSYALLYQVDPATIPGISAAHSKDDYGRRALQFGTHIASRLPGGFQEPHHGASSLASGEGGVASLALQVVYDWTHSLSSLSEKKALADRLITLWNGRYSSDKIKLENHYAANSHVYAGALCFYGDEELGSSYTSKAQTMMDSYDELFINRQMEVAERLHEGSSDWTEGDGYLLDGYTGLMFLAAAASSAIDEDLFEKYSWLREAPLYIYNIIVPKPYKGTYYYYQQNTSGGMSLEHPGLSTLMNISAARLEKINPNMSSFAAWFCEESIWGHKVNEYKYYKPHLFDFYYKFLFGTKHIENATPDQTKIPLSNHLGQMHAMRSDHSFDDYTLINFFAFKYLYPGGHNELEMGAFNIHRFGTLAVSASNTKGAPDGIPRVQDDGKGLSMNNTFCLGEGTYLDPDAGSISERNSDTPEAFVEGAIAHIGNVEAREYKPDWHDYINYNYTRSYKEDSAVSLARRALVYLRGEVNHEFVVVMDRVQTSKTKKFIMHIPVEAEAIGGSWGGASNNFKPTSAKQIRVTNRIDQSHGQMVLTAVFPEDAAIHQAGGSGKEWVLANGTPLPYRGAFGELAAYLLGDHTIQIRSEANQFLTVMQIGDANTMGNAASIEKLSGNNFIGVNIGKERVVIFSDSESKIESITYHVNSSQKIKHLITELPKNRDFTVKKSGAVVADGTTGVDGTISFEDNPGGDAAYAISIGGVSSGIDEARSTIPEDMQLGNYPNPFNPSTTISFSLTKAAEIELEVYNMLGQKVRSLLSEIKPAGQHKIKWDAIDDNGKNVASGLYLYKLKTGSGATLQNKMLFLK
ncbi:MAG: T9SS C-terminal target domain-containing protein [Calditrichaeota bacterium]|nr:MAG: T9SS C-terminal target domain-containing protein [Calditrichota bacterium]